MCGGVRPGAPGRDGGPGAVPGRFPAAPPGVRGVHRTPSDRPAGPTATPAPPAADPADGPGPVGLSCFSSFRVLVIIDATRPARPFWAALPVPRASWRTGPG